MKNGIQKKISRLMDGILRPFFSTIQSKVRNFIKERVFGNIVREMIIEHIMMSQQHQKPLSIDNFKDFLPKPKYGAKINVIKSYFGAQDFLFGQVSEESFMDQLKTMTIKEVDALYESIDKMNESIHQRKDFSFWEVEKKSNKDALNLQKELDNRGFVQLEEEIDDNKDK